MFTSFDNEGRVETADKPEGLAVTPFYDAETEKFYKLEPVTIHGVVTQRWVETSPTNTQYDPISGKYYTLVLINVHGELTQKWIEVTS